MTTIYGMIDSGNCYKPRLLMAKLGRPFKHVEVSSHDGSTRSDAFTAKNPNAMVPLLELDDGRLLAESNAILLHLGEGTRFVPEDAYERALAYQWLFFEQYSHEPYIAVRRALLTFPNREEGRNAGTAGADAGARQQGAAGDGKALGRNAVLRRTGAQRRRHRALCLYACGRRGRLRPRRLSRCRRLAAAASRAIPAMCR